MTSTADRAWKVLFGIASVAFVGAAISHIVRGVAPAPDDTSGGLRHAVFVLIDLAAAVGLQARPWWFPLPFGILLAQQSSTHGADALAAVQAGAAPAAVDAAVIVFMPLALALLLLDLRRTAARRTGAAPAPTEDA